MSVRTARVASNVSDFFAFKLSDVQIDLLPNYGQPEQKSSARVALSATRFVLQNYPCDKLPVIMGLALNLTPNEYGDVLLAEIWWGGEGWRTLIAGKVVDGRIEWSVYMD